MSYTQALRKLRVTTPLGEDVLVAKGFHGTETISRLFRFEVELLAKNGESVDFAAVLGSPMTIHLAQPDEASECHFNGLCVRFAQGPRGEEFTSYRAELAPRLWLLTRQARSRTFQHIRVPDILQKLLAGLDVDYQLTGKYEERDYCVQYRETDFNFLARLMEEEGIYFFFRHGDGTHQLVVADNPAAHPMLPGVSTFVHEELSGGVRDDNRIWRLEKAQQLRSGKLTLWDHSFELPHKHLEVESLALDTVKVGSVTHKLRTPLTQGLELYDYPGEYAQRFDGIDRSGGEQPAELQKVFTDNRRTAEVRMDEESASSLQVRAESNVKHLSPGFLMKVSRHFSSDDTYLILGVSHAGSFGADFRAQADAVPTYRNELLAQPAALKFRPARLTSKPVVHGSQTAIVVGPAGEEIFTDKYGRVKVQFHWDREGKSDADSSCWIRVATTWAGRQWGAVHIPRIGQEVVVDFLEGDPDRPIVIGSVYNAREMPPYTLPARKTQSGVKSRSTLRGGTEDFNEIRFEDLKGKEQVYVHAQKDFLRIVEHDDELEVGNDQRILVKRDRHEQVDRDEAVLVKGRRLHDVEGDDGLWVAGTKGRAIRIENGDHVLTVDKGNVTLEVKMGNQTTKLGMGNQETKLDLGNVTTKASLGSISQEALQSIELKVGQSSVKVDQMGVTIKGMMVSVEGQVQAKVQGLMTQVSADAMLQASGAIVMIG